MEASSSSCSSNFEHDVFLSFRGEDTRYNFISHLYEALVNKGISTFKDDKELERGKYITPSLLEAIENSKIALIVFSPNYAFSPWCLDELVKIVRCKETKNQIVLPIFFKVDPSDIEGQTGVVAKAFEEHEQNFKNDTVQVWRNALSTVATISGWDAKSFGGDEAAFVKCIVKNIADRLFCDGSCFESELVGIDFHMKKMLRLLGFEYNKARMVGIWGPGGIGKTTIAEVIFRRYRSKFEACCSLKNIKEKHKREGGLIYLQREFISQIFSKEINVWEIESRWDIIHTRLRKKKVLIVLDDVDDLKQLNIFVRKIEWFGEGSRIIITTRDKHLLISHDVQYIYEVQLLEEHQALQLFSLHAFKKSQAPENYLDLSKKFVSYAKGLPLAIEVLGASLCRKEEYIWREEFEKLKKIPKTDIIEVLKRSLDRLDDTVRAVFLDIVFFFMNGYSETFVKPILSRCGFYPESALAILQDKALLKMEYSAISIHEVVREMGYEVVKEESKDVRKRSRVCHRDDVFSLLKSGKGSKTIEGISLNMLEIESLDLNPKAFRRMDKLRILHFYIGRNSTSDGKGTQFSVNLSFLPETLRYIYWDQFPAKSLPSNFHGKNLVALILCKSGVEHIWTKDPELVNLMHIDLSDSICLKTLPNLSKAIRIEQIILQGCESFIGFSHDLQHLDRLECLDLNGCSKFDKLPRLPSNLQVLDLSKTAIKELSSDIHLLTKLEYLDLKNCKKLSALPIEIGTLESLSELYLDGSGIKELPQSIINLRELTELRLIKCTELVGLPSCMHEFSLLSTIYVGGCKSLCSLPVLPPSLEMLIAEDCYSLEMLPHNVLNGNLGKLILLNCVKLDRKARDEVMKHCNKMVLHSENSVNYTVPGEEIPDWFHYKSCGSSITIKLPPYVDQIKRIAYSVVVGPYDQHPQHSGHLNCDVEDIYFEVKCNHFYFPQRPGIVISSCALLDHVLVWFTFRTNEFPDLIVGRDFQFDFMLTPIIKGNRLCDENECADSPLMIKKCGVYLITDKKDFETDPSTLDDQPNRATRKRKAENNEEAEESVMQ